MGIMGVGAGFLQAACAKAKKVSENELVLKSNLADPDIFQLTCVGEISVESIKNGEPVVRTYTDLDRVQVSVEADIDTDITIKGNVTSLILYKPFPPCPDFTVVDTKNCKSLTELNVAEQTNIATLDVSANTELVILQCGRTGIATLDVSANTKLKVLSCLNTGITTLDVSENTELKSLCCYNTGITTLDVSANTELVILQCGRTGITSLNTSTHIRLEVLDCSGCAALTSLDCSGCDALVQIKYGATNQDVSTAIAGAITAATNTGTVYTDSEGVYYSTIADAATAKGWTIEQL